jgi:hypothetical protein
MPTAADAGRAVALAFFASHIPVTLFVDSQVGERVRRAMKVSRRRG